MLLFQEVKVKTTTKYKIGIWPVKKRLRNHDDLFRPLHLLKVDQTQNFRTAAIFRCLVCLFVLQGVGRLRR